MPEKKSNIVTFKGNEYTFVENNLLFKENSKLLKHKYTLLTEEHIKDIDQSVIEDYEGRLGILNLAISQLNGTGDKAEKKRKDDLIKRRDEEQRLYDSDLEVKSIRRLLKVRENFVLEDILTDMTFLKGIFEKILTGDLDKLDLQEDDAESIKFAIEVISLFFSFSSMNKLKLTK